MYAVPCYDYVWRVPKHVLVIFTWTCSSVLPNFFLHNISFLILVHIKHIRCMFSWWCHRQLSGLFVFAFATPLMVPQLPFLHICHFYVSLRCLHNLTKWAFRIFLILTEIAMHSCLLSASLCWPQARECSKCPLANRILITATFPAAQMRSQNVLCWSCGATETCF